MVNTAFYRKKKVLITGHTGFKGTWMCQTLLQLGADVTGYALKPPTEPSLFALSHMEDRMDSIEGDIRDLEHLRSVFAQAQPEIVIHMAAQPIVRESYRDPVYTYDVNVMGTVNVLECVRTTPSVRSFVNVTTDKVYKNREWDWGYRENEELNGYDPYSNSKSCSELVTDSYRNSFFADGRAAISTARAGNVIGGGDFAADRIVPDCFRAIQENREIIVRNPYSIRPYQHVLEPMTAYLLIAQKQYEDGEYADCYNIGPREESCLTTGGLVTDLCRQWERLSGNKTEWKHLGDGGPHEARFLKLDCSKIKHRLGWSPVWGREEMIAKTAEWWQEYLSAGDIVDVMKRQIEEYFHS
ncbi:MAG: CDP-glucose 4,6-dehydratase [Lachnospiraceae bacterium]|nr:CDP-glucose 4,6-dehydratase [Lachnospiraceae bacterium]MCM1239667.1 CDP-glucose 4,6-dehydratase [Lachnospiraceae bacterium]